MGRIAVTARGLKEYRKLFAISDEEIAAKSFLDCAAGGSPFSAQVRSLGGIAMSADPSYENGFVDAMRRVRSNLEGSATWFADREDIINRSSIGSDEEYYCAMSSNAALFLADATEHPQLYVKASLPDLPVASRGVVEFSSTPCGSVL